MIIMYRCVVSKCIYDTKRGNQFPFGNFSFYKWGKKGLFGARVLIGIIILPNYSILSAFLFDVYTLKNSIKCMGRVIFKIFACIFLDISCQQLSIANLKSICTSLCNSCKKFHKLRVTNYWYPFIFTIILWDL